MEFKKVTLDTVNQIIHCTHLSDFSESNFTIGILLLWADEYDLYYYEEDETMIFRGKSPRAHVYYSYPIGKNPSKILAKLPRPCTLMYVPESKIGEFDTYEKTLIPDDFDYVYTYQDLLGLHGKHKAYMRNHINRFLKDHPNHRYEKITLAHQEDLKKIIAGQTVKKPGRLDDDLHNLMAIDLYDKLSLIGGILYADNNPVAFSIGEIIGPMLYVNFEKRVDNVEGASDYNRWSFLDMYKDEKILYVNREDDAGDPGLRMAKQRMGPCYYIHKYRVELK